MDRMKGINLSQLLIVRLTASRSMEPGAMHQKDQSIYLREQRMIILILIDGVPLTDPSGNRRRDRSQTLSQTNWIIWRSSKVLKPARRK